MADLGPRITPLTGAGDGSVGEVLDGLMVTGHFLATMLAPSLSLEIKP